MQPEGAVVVERCLEVSAAVVRRCLLEGQFAVSLVGAVQSVFAVGIEHVFIPQAGFAVFGAGKVVGVFALLVVEVA